jgi:hypothetical protein
MSIQESAADFVEILPQFFIVKHVGLNMNTAESRKGSKMTGKAILATGRGFP